MPSVWWKKYWSPIFGLIEVYRTPSNRRDRDSEIQLDRSLELFGEADNGWFEMFVSDSGKLYLVDVATGEIQEPQGDDFLEFLGSVDAEEVPSGFFRKMLFRFRMKGKALGKKPVRC